MAFDCRAGEGEQVWETMVEEKQTQKNPQATKWITEVSRKETLQVEAVRRVLATQPQRLHQHHLHPTWTASADACQQATELL